MCVCVCVCVCEENGKENTYKWMRKIYRKNINELVPPTHFDIDYLRYEITKISSKKYFCHLQGGNYEFKIVV